VRQPLRYDADQQSGPLIGAELHAEAAGLANLGQNLIGEQAFGSLSLKKSHLNRYPIIQQPFGAEITP
jgi:hypothetical protein